MDNYTIFWFRRDLRFNDNKGLYYSLMNHKNVIPLFIFDTNILDKLHPKDARVHFIHKTLMTMNYQLEEEQKQMWVYYGQPKNVFLNLLEKIPVKAVYINKDHEPYGVQRDEEIENILKEKGVKLHAYLDHLFFEKEEVLKADTTPYQVFTPYSKKCHEILTDNHFTSYPSENLLDSFTQDAGPHFPSLKEIGFSESGVEFPVKTNKDTIIDNYHETRNFPAQTGTTRLGVHLRFGSISLRKLGKHARIKNATFFNELIWREFYAMILWHYPHVVNQSFKPLYDRIEWRNDVEEFELWKQGKTGYPIVDAGMRELMHTGYMHNRVRMITASFLTKHLLIDWRWGEAWFAEKLLDYELSSNNGGWQWSAGTGVDAAPYFRIFNPTEQQKKFDPLFAYIKKWVPEFNTKTYPESLVDHKFARKRCLEVFKAALNS